MSEPLGSPTQIPLGDCDTDDDCIDELVCFQREAFEPVPGCSGGGEVRCQLVPFPCSGGGYFRPSEHFT